jgi:DNA (cytosine-5)-methyltransferase 1
MKTIKITLKPKAKLISRLKFIDLFCGLGAFHQAFKAKNMECVYACDINDPVRKIYAKNHGLMPAGDIRTIDPALIPNFDILCAGFPCQPFSIAGNGQGFKDNEKGNLFYEILKIIDAKTPEMCIFENVKNLKTHDNGKTYQTIETALTTRGYYVNSEIINSAICGSPQSRHRIFIVASKKVFTFPPMIPVYNPVSTIIDSNYRSNTIDLSKYELVKKKTTLSQDHPCIVYDVISKKTGKGGRQGERVYDINTVGITICATSGGIGSKTGLYLVNGIVRKLSVTEALAMFGFRSDYDFLTSSSEDSLFFLGNSIVVNVISYLLPEIEKYFG